MGRNLGGQSVSLVVNALYSPYLVGQPLFDSSSDGKLTTPTTRKSSANNNHNLFENTMKKVTYSQYHKTHKICRIKSHQTCVTLVWRQL